ncbi:MAG: Lar family restriction alleviation protein [Candidatus Ornithospirochaeta sp.]
MDKILEELDIFECPICQGTGLLEEENGWCFYVMCMDCGCHTAECSYKGEEDRFVAAKNATVLWNRGKVLSSNPGE